MIKIRRTFGKPLPTAQSNLGKSNNILAMDHVESNKEFEGGKTYTQTLPTACDLNDPHVRTGPKLIVKNAKIQRPLILLGYLCQPARHTPEPNNSRA